MKTLLLPLFIIFISIEVYAQSETIDLLKPTGKFLVGTVVFEWTDETRELNLSSHKGEKRTIIVQMWYPAKIDSSDLLSPYSALSREYEYVKTNSYTRPSVADALKKYPLVLYSPGRGMERYVYTILIEDLASHGFIVASVDMPEIGNVVYKDGFNVKPATKFKPPRGMMAGPYKKVDEFFEKPVEVGNRDLEFVLEKIAGLNKSDLNRRFTNRINLEKIGIFGHSLGGRIAGEFTANNAQIIAYIAMEGIPPRDVRYKGKIGIPTVMLCSSGTLPYAIENYKSYYENRGNTVYMIELLDFGHNSVTDIPFISPSTYNYGIEAQRGLEISREIVTNYFITHLNNQGVFTDMIKNLENINLTIYK